MFNLGMVVSTPGAIDAMMQHHVGANELLQRHLKGDWGELDPEDKESNDQAVLGGWRILSSYIIAPGVTIWVITEADRSATTFLLPEDY